MSDHDVILNDIEEQAEKFEMKARSYGEDLGAPYRDAAEKLRVVAEAYETSLPSGECDQ